jgi:hypothetical protein
MCESKTANNDSASQKRTLVGFGDHNVQSLWSSNDQMSFAFPSGGYPERSNNIFRITNAPI